MKTFRIFLVMVVLVVAADFLVPVLSAKNAILFSMIRDNCGFVPIFLDQIFDYTTRTPTRVYKGFIKCGTGVLGFLVLPGFLTLIIKLYRFVKHG